MELKSEVTGSLDKSLVLDRLEIGEAGSATDWVG
jgi:hypothetical protein